MITFTRAATVAVGDAVTSRQIISLARAWNDRILSGVGDCLWRLAYWHANLWRQIRNPSSNGNVFPPQLEFFDIYQHIDPEHAVGVTWPIAGPGEPEGCNLANVMAQFVFGSPWEYSEPDRLADFPVSVLGYDPTKLEYYWELGKLQRGGYDPDTGAQACPAFTAAQGFFRISTPWFSPHGKGYGAYFPAPTELLTDCGTTADTGLGVPSYEIKVTGLTSDTAVPDHHGTLTYDGDGRPVVTYAGSCPCGTDYTDIGHVLGMAEYPFGIYVAVATAVNSDCDSLSYEWDRFPSDEWIVGPYTGEATLAHSDGKQLHRALWAFVSDFRGMESERGAATVFGQYCRQLGTTDKFDVRTKSFDNQSFGTRQYPLAPARGQEVDASTLQVVYPRQEWTSTQAVDARGAWAGEGQYHVLRDGFVVGGVYVKADGLEQDCTITLEDEDGDTLTTVTVRAGSDLTGETLTWFNPALTTASIQTRLGAGLRLAAGGSLSLEIAEVLDYQPEFWDAYLVLRLGASQGGSSIQAGVDGRGVDATLGPTISRNLFTYGCAVPGSPDGVRGQGEWINDNPVYDTARRLSRDHVRIIPRRQFVAYEVDANGDAHIYLRRYAYGMDGIRADMLHNLAPPIDAVTSLIVGETYIVRGSGNIIHNGEGFSQDQTFTATATDFTVSGDAAVYVYDGIRSTAFRNGWTNRWAMQMETKVYLNSSTSVWKPESYADYFAFNQRCLFYGGNVPSAAFRRHIDYQYKTDLTADYDPNLLPESVQAQLISPEAPTGYRYSSGSNSTSPTAEFLTSCQVYEAPYEITSCTVDTWQPDQIVKMTLSRRPTAHPDAPAAVPRDVSTWTADEKLILRNEYTGDPAVNEDYRTDDNALREYALMLYDDSQADLKTGDRGMSSSLSTVNGSCFPMFILAHLMPEPYEDDNTTAETTDARCTMDAMLHAECLTRACCEGFVDGETTLDLMCGTGYTGGLYDFSYENLCFQAFSGKWIGAFSLDARDDNPMGFGPLPNTLLYADVFNRLSGTVNLLTRARLDLPMVFHWREHHYENHRDYPPTYNNYECDTETDGLIAWIDDAPNIGKGAEAAGSPTAYSDDATIQAQASYYMGTCPYGIDADHYEIEYYIKIDGDFYLAVPDTLLAHVNAGGVGFIAKKTIDYHNWDRAVTTPGSGEYCGSVSDALFDGDGNIMVWNDAAAAQAVTCEMVSSGTLVPVEPGDGDLYMGVQYYSGSYHICTNAIAAETTMELLTDRCAFIEVGLVDL